MTKKILLLSGDPNSINTEIIYKSWVKLNKVTRKKLIIIGSYKLLASQFKKLNYRINLNVINNINSIYRNSSMNILDVPVKFKNSFKVNFNDNSKYIIECFKLAHKLAQLKLVKGIINCPIDKKLLGTNNKFGVTEYLARKCNINDKSELMLIYNKNLSVAPITTHIDIGKVSKKLNFRLIIKKALTLNRGYRRLFRKTPKIGILGLNPHNGELRKNSEEVKFIIPAINRLKKKNIKISGPFSADTIFINDYKKFDVVLGMYHDQVLAPFKTLFKYDAFNLTLGLKYIRVSPDHGTAQSLVKKNKANYLSLTKCINFINNLKL